MQKEEKVIPSGKELNSYDAYWEAANRNREYLKKGIPLLIPFPFPSLASKIPGIVPSSQVIITGSSGLGKSKITRFLFIKEAIKFANSNNLPIKIFLNSLEESREKVVSTLIADRLKDKYGIDTDFYELNQYHKHIKDSNWKKVEEAKEWVKSYYGPYLEIVSENIPTVFYKVIRKDLARNGKFYFIKKDGQKIISKTLCERSTDMWNHYEPNKYRIVIAISDTINQYIGTKDKSKYDAIYEFSSDLCRQKLGIKCGVISILVAQQAEDIKKIETNFKGNTELDKLKPSAATIKTCRAIYEHCTLCFGLFNPAEYGQTVYNEVDLENMDCGKYLAFIILKTREGSVHYPYNEVNLCAEFAHDHFSEIIQEDE